uniref:ABC transporter AlkB n=1 Tax=Bacillus sp. NTT89 TaxID=151288 RepID=Q9AP11_9BACI|nr:ABC transporter AlkB [Bacillus sp. NTT89]
MNLLYQETFTGRIMLRVEDVSGMVGKRVLWEKTSFYIRGGDKVAIIGPNGSGKTTLVKKIINEEEGIILSPSMKIGYFSQNLTILDPDKTILENVRSTSIQDETLIRTILARLHFFREDVHKPIHVLSGGERVKVALAKLFVSNCNTLILDEPTNYLDTEAVRIEAQQMNELTGFKYERDTGRFILETKVQLDVSHDGARIQDSNCTLLWIIEDGTYRVFSFNYEDGEQISYTKMNRLSVGFQEKAAQTTYGCSLRSSRGPTEHMALRVGFKQEWTEQPFSQAVVLTRLEKLDQVEKPKEAPPLKMGLLNTEQFTGRMPIVKNLSNGMIEFQFLWTQKDYFIPGGEKIKINGANGVGKTTLKVKGINFEMDIHLKKGYYDQELTILDKPDTHGNSVRSTGPRTESLANSSEAMRHFYRFLDHKPIHNMSGGEKTAFLFPVLCKGRNNLLILDEPTSNYDCDAVEACMPAGRKNNKVKILFVKIIEHVGKKLIFEDEKYELEEKEDGKNRPMNLRDESGITDYPGADLQKT